MPRENYTDITVILDRSGSMGSIKQATIEGFNNFVREQKDVPGDGCWSLVQFDDQYEVVYAGKPQHEVPLLTIETFLPRGWTALVDAVCRTIDQTGQRLAALPEALRPSKVLLMILTDGEENHSTEYTTQQLHTKITHQREKYNWNFIFLGANQDAYAVAQKYGISKGNAMNYVPTAAGTHAAYGAANVGTRNWKLDGNQSADNLLGNSTPDDKKDSDVQVSVSVKT